MSFQSEVDRLFATTLYENYNKELSVVVGKTIDNKELDKINDYNKADFLSK